MIGALLLAALAISLGGCGGDEADDASSGGGETFKIGYSADLSDGYSSYDTPILQGVEYAIDEINAAGGIDGMQLELLYKDNKNDKALAIQTTQELINSGIQYMIGTTSDNVTAINRLAGDKEIPSDTGDGTAPNLPRDNGEYSFQYIMGDNVQGAAMANYCYTTSATGPRTCCARRTSPTPPTCPPTSPTSSRSSAARSSAPPTTSWAPGTSPPRSRRSRTRSPSRT